MNTYMSKLDTQNINVLNYNENAIFVDSAKEHYSFSASRDGKNPSIIPMSLSELQYIASNTNVIMTGWLTFEDEVKEEIYKELRIANWKDILSNEEIKSILTKPTLEGLQKIIDIDNQTYFDRVRICMFKLMNDGFDITTKVSRIVNQRYEELQRRQRNSSIILKKKDTTISSDKVQELSEQNASLQSQLDEMKKMVEQMMSMKETIDVTETSNKDDSSDTTSSPKKVGRPKKTV